MANNNQREGSSSSSHLSRLFRCFKPSQPDQQPDRSSTRGTTEARARIRSYFAHGLSPWYPGDIETALVFPAGVTGISSFLCPQQLFEQRQVRSLAVSQDGLLYAGSCSKDIRVWYGGNPYANFYARNGPIYALVVDQQGRVFSAHFDGSIRVWERNARNPAAYRQVTTLPRPRDGFPSMVPPRNVTLRTLRWQDHVFTGHYPFFVSPVTCLCLSEDGRFLYSSSLDHALKVWRVQDWRFIGCVGIHAARVSAVAAGCNHLVFSGAADGCLTMWIRVGGMNDEFPTHVLVQTLMPPGTSVNALALRSTPTGKAQLYAGLSDNRILFWQEEADFGDPETMPHHEAEVSCIAVSPGSLVFSGSRDGLVCIWRREDDNTHTYLSELRMAHQGPVTSLAACRDWEEHDNGPRQCILYSGGGVGDRSVKTWRVVDVAAVEHAQQNENVEEHEILTWP